MSQPKTKLSFPLLQKEGFNKSTMIIPPKKPSSLSQDQIHCPSCDLSLERNLFRKKDVVAKYNDKDGTYLLICRSCKRAANAERCKQPLPPNTQRDRVGESGVKRRPNNHGFSVYVDKMFSMKCFPDIVNLRVFTSAKDISESMGSINAASRFGNMEEYDSGAVLCLCIGDGSTPRTAVLVAFIKSGWKTISIDPNLKDEWVGPHKKVKGMVGYKGKLEDFMLEPNQKHIPCLSFDGMIQEFDNEELCKQGEENILSSIKHLVLLCVHSHVQFRKSTKIENVRARYGYPRTTLVSIPCCPKFRHLSDIGRQPDHKYEDDCIFSACRTISVWNFVEGKIKKEKPEVVSNAASVPANYCSYIS